MTDEPRPPSDALPAAADTNRSAARDPAASPAGVAHDVESLGDQVVGRAEPPVLSTFSLEGRRVPALYLVGWVGSVMGLAVVLVSFMASDAGLGRWVFLAGLVMLALGLVAAAGSQAIERSGRSELAYRGPSPVLAFVVVLVATLLAVLVVLAPLSALGMDPTTPAATTISLALTALAYVVVVRVLVVGPGSLTWAEMGVVRPDSAAIRDLMLGALLALPVLIVTVALSAILSTFLERTPSPLPVPDDGVGFLFNLVSAMILAPIGEELFFRGFATTAWVRALGKAWPAIIRGAVFFAIAHVLTLFDASFSTGLQRAAFSFVALLPVAVTLGWLFLARRSLYAAIGLHGAFNGIQVLLLFVAGNTLVR